MIDAKSIGDVVKLINGFNCYTFVEDTHTYYYNGSRVRTSVTQFIGRYFPEFDKDNISKKYAKKHGLSQEEVLAEWDKKGKVSALSGTAIHSYLENLKRGKVFGVDFSNADKEGLGEEVRERFELIKPKADAFHQDTLGRLFPIQLEYTVGLEDFIAGNIDFLCWNEAAQEIQIWDYKNVKEISKTNNFRQYCNYPFSGMPDCNYVHYSIQLNVYKAILQRVLGVRVGAIYLVHFDYTKPDDSFEIHPCLDLVDIVNEELDKLISGEIVL